MKDWREKDRVLSFLKGLGEQFLNVKSQIFLMKPTPSISKVFSLIIQQERQLTSKAESRLIIATKGFDAM